MLKPEKTFIILTPAFAADENDSYLPAQESFIRMLNELYPFLQIVILTFHFPVGRQREYNWFGNKVIAFGGAMKGKLHSLLLWNRVWKTLSLLCKGQDIIGVFSFFCSESAFIGHHFARRNKLKHHIWVLGQDARKENKQVKRLRPASEELVTISDFLVREFERNHKIRPAHVIPIGINPDDFGSTASERNIDLIGAGSLSALKQYKMFVDVVKIIADQIPDINTMLCGNGPEEANLRNQIESLHLSERITMTGLKRDRTEVLQLLLQSKILLHTSSYEGFGMICTEALYAGAQVISFIKPMDAPIQNWHIVDSVEAMAAKAVALLSNHDKKYERLLPYAMKDTAAKIMALYNYSE